MAAYPPVYQDLGAATFTVIGTYAFLKVFEKLTQNGAIQQSVSRKIVHSLVGPLFITTWLLYSQDSGARYYALLVPTLQALRLFLVGTGIIQDKKFLKSLSRKDDPKELVGGPFYYIIIIMVSTVLWRNNMAGVIMLSILSVGDGLADLVGRKYGASLRLPYNQSKSVVGSASMFIGGSLAAIWQLYLFSKFGYIDATLDGIIIISTITCFLCTIVESLPINNVIDDNISIPVTAYFASVYLSQLLVA